MEDKHLTTDQGVAVTDDKNSLSVGQRGLVFLQDIHRRLFDTLKGALNELC